MISAEAATSSIGSVKATKMIKYARPTQSDIRCTRFGTDIGEAVRQSAVAPHRKRNARRGEGGCIQRAHGRKQGAQHDQEGAKGHELRGGAGDADLAQIAQPFINDGAFRRLDGPQ